MEFAVTLSAGSDEQQLGCRYPTRRTLLERTGRRLGRTRQVSDPARLLDLLSFYKQRRRSAGLDARCFHASVQESEKLPGWRGFICSMVDQIDPEPADRSLPANPVGAGHRVD